MTRTTASRVLLVIDGLNSGGAQQQLVRMFLGMRSRDVDVHLVYYSPHHHFVPQIPDVTVGRLVTAAALSLLGPDHRSQHPAIPWRVASQQSPPPLHRTLENN